MSIAAGPSPLAITTKKIHYCVKKQQYDELKELINSDRLITSAPQMLFTHIWNCPLAVPNELDGSVVVDFEAYTKAIT